MAIIKDFISEKNKRQQDNNIDYREKIRAHRLSVAIRTVVGIIVVAAIIVLLSISYKSKIYTSVTVTSSEPVSVVTGATARNLNGSLLIYSKDGASCVDSKGHAIWNESYEMQAPIVSICGSTVAIGDYNGRNIYVANSSKILGTVKTNLPIRNVCVSDNGVVAAVLDDSDVIRIFVYDGNSNTEEPIVQAKATMAKSGYPISISLSPNGKIMMVTYFYVDSGDMKSTVSFYNFGEVGSNEVDNFVSGFDYKDILLPYTCYMNNSTAFGVANDRIVFFSGDEVPESVATGILSEEVIAVFNSNEYVGLVFRDTTGDHLYRLDTYNMSGNKMSSIGFDMDYTDIMYNKDQVIIYGGLKCSIYNVKGEPKFEGMFDKSVNLMIPTNSLYRYLIITGDTMDYVEFN